MNILRVYAMVLRHFYNLCRSFDRLSDMFYWPAIDLIIWGLTGFYFVSIFPNSTLMVNAIIGGVLLWIVPWRAQIEISINVLVELWDRNLGNVFVSPFKFFEWVVSLMIIGLIKGTISLFFAAIVAYLFYNVNIFMYGWGLLYFVILLYIFGWAIGFLVGSVVLRYGSRIQTLAWTVPWAAAPFSAIYFPVSILPAWGQNISYFIPASYVFEAAREVVFKHTLNWNYIGISLILNLFYLSISIFLFWRSYRKALERGLQGIH